MKKKSSIFLLLLSCSFSLFSQRYSKYKYAKEPLSVMHMNGNSVRVDVERKLSSWGIKYEQTGFDAFENLLFNKFGGGATSVYEKLTFDGFVIEQTHFYYSRSGRLEVIEMFIDKSYSFEKIKKEFDMLKSEYPERRSITYYLPSVPNMKWTMYVLNGANDNESIVFDVVKPYTFTFFFGGKQLEWFKRYAKSIGEW